MPRLTERQQMTNDLMMAYIAANMGSEDAEESSSSSSSGMDVDSSSSTDSEELLAVPGLSQPPGLIYLEMIADIHSTRYIHPRRHISKTTDNIYLLLNDWINTAPDIFRTHVRVTPECFRALLAALEDDPVFHNQSQNEQMPVAEQLAITLYRFGHYGNAASTLKVALWAGVGYGTVDRVTKRVITALCSGRFRHAAVKFPPIGDVRREAAKVWVEMVSCPAWRDGWLMVDGTLVPLWMRPGHFGNTFYDRKSNYSMNVQVRI